MWWWFLYVFISFAIAIGFFYLGLLEGRNTEAQKLIEEIKDLKIFHGGRIIGRLVNEPGVDTWTIRRKTHRTYELTLLRNNRTVMLAEIKDTYPDAIDWDIE
jgi:hypothetical protein